MRHLFIAGRIIDMRKLIISCNMLKDELEKALSLANSREFDIVYTPRELHADPKKLHSLIQKKIDENQDADQIYICISACGGATSELMSQKSQLILAKTQDCIEVLLSPEDGHIEDIERDEGGIFYTKGWIDFNKSGGLNLKKMRAEKGRAQADKEYKEIYKGFKNFYIIDTACFDVEEVKDYIKDSIELLEGNLEIIKGDFGIFKKIASGNIDRDFIRVAPGEKSPYVPTWLEKCAKAKKEG